MRNTDSRDTTEANINHDFVPEELRGVVQRICARILEKAVELRFSSQTDRIAIALTRESVRKNLEQNIYDKYVRERNIQRLRADLKTRMDDEKEALKQATSRDFSTAELIEALKQSAFSDLLFLQGKLKTNLDSNQAGAMGKDRIINDTKVVIELSNGIMVVGLSQDELALSFAVYYTSR